MTNEQERWIGQGRSMPPNCQDSKEAIFNDEFSPNETAVKMADEISTFLMPLYQRWVVREGLSPRQLSYVVNDVNKLMEAQFLLSVIGIENIKFE